MSCDEIDLKKMKKFNELLRKKETENNLMKRVLEYAKKGEYTRYTSTLEEAWRVSIHGLTESLLLTTEECENRIPELHVDLDYVKDPAAGFGIHEAKLHRSRGITLDLFLSLTKYYAQSYVDFIRQDTDFDDATKDFFELYIRRFYDRVEIGFASEWASSSRDKLMNELQTTNKLMTNEKNKYLTIFESLNTPVILINQKNEIENANKKAMEYFEGLLSPGSQYYAKTDINLKLDWLLKLLNEFMKSKLNDKIYEREVDTRLGKRHFEISLKKMLDVSEKFSGTVIILNDVTERIEYENLRKQFVSTVSHELRTPISAIDLSIKLIEKHKEKLSKDRIDRLIHNISKGSTTLSKMVEDLLILSRIDDAKIKLIKEDFDVKEKLTSVLEELDSKRQVKSIELEIDVEDLLIINADEFRVGQIFRILIDNAIKYSNENSTIQIKTSACNEGKFNPKSVNGILFQVTDNGIGIKEKDLKNLFVRFFRSDEVREIKGTGLGLSIAKELVELHGGEIFVESEYRKGSTFTVFLPKEAVQA